MTDTTALIRSYLADVARLLAAVDVAEVDRIVDAVCDAWREDRTVLVMGNGGSSGSASHIVADLQKNIQMATGRALRTICLTDSTPLLSAWANDTEWDNVFAPQVECWVKPGDIVLGVSGSGNSMNVVNAINTANRLGARTIGLAGYSGGKLKGSAQVCIVVECDNMQCIEDVHISLLHVVFLAVMSRLCGDSPAERRS